MAIFIAIVSHNQSKLINRLGQVKCLARNYQVVIKSNTAFDSFEKLSANENVTWLNEQYSNGFGTNNNIIFEYCRRHLAMTDSDFFLVLNPDVLVNTETIQSLAELAVNYKAKIATLNLYLGTDSSEFDYSIRKFPSLFTFIKSFFGFKQGYIYDKATIKAPCQVDWAAGSLLMFNVAHYIQLDGFDERYFMYCEDIDICFRSACMDEKTWFFPNLSAHHLVGKKNRNVWSRHFYWHVSSIMRFTKKYRNNRHKL